MTRKRAYIPLNIFINGRHAGTLSRQSSGAVRFQYAPSWLEWEYRFAISLSLQLRKTAYTGAPVIAVFDNLLPDNDTIRRAIAERVGAAGIDTYSLLAQIGRDCIGAMQFVPEDEIPEPTDSIQVHPLSEKEISNILRNLSSAPLGLQREDDFRISIAGAQEKTALLRMNDKWYRPLGTTPTTHILKPQIRRHPTGINLSNSVENEYLCLKFIEAFGIPTAKASIESFLDHKVLVVERFDRQWTETGKLIRIPQEDCCQALSVPSTQKYEAESGPGIAKIINLLKGSDKPADDIINFLQAITLFILLGATDGHAKNFSIFLSAGGRFHMTPIYDVISAQPAFDAHTIRRNQMKMAMAVGTNRHYIVDDILPHHLIQTSNAVGVGSNSLKTFMRVQLETVPTIINSVIAALPPDFPESVTTSIMNGVRTRAERMLRDPTLNQPV